MSLSIHNRARQEGVALLVVMVMLFVVTVLGISSMRESNLERRMATNSAVAAATFQAAESATDVALNNSGNLTTAWGVPGNTVTHMQPAAAAGKLAIETKLTYLGEGPALGYSLGQSGGGFVALRYDVRATAAIDSLTASAKVGQNAYRIAPSN